MFVGSIPIMDPRPTLSRLTVTLILMGDWTLVWSYSSTNYIHFNGGCNAIAPRPNWPAKNEVNVPISTIPLKTIGLPMILSEEIVLTKRKMLQIHMVTFSFESSRKERL